MTTTNTAAARWERLRADLATAGLDARVSVRPYAQERYGRVEFGETYSITVSTGQRTLQIGDRYGRGGKWYGWTAHYFDRDYATRGQVEVLRSSTRRSDVVAATVSALTERITK